MLQNILRLCIVEERKLELQNDLAKRLAESKYSGEKVKTLPPGVVLMMIFPI